MTDPLAAIFEARSVAVVGASADSRKRGHQVVRSLLGSAYEGDILPVHPDGGTLLGLPVARSVTDLPCCPDLALVCTRAASVPGVLERCAGRGVKGAVILAVGFDESGPEGEALAREVGAIADRTGLRVIGPNTSGFMNPGLGLNLVGIRAVEVGRMALLSQSGNVALDIITRASAGSVGISLYVGIGNELDVRFHEYISYLETHRASEVILIYAEGFRDGRAFMHAVSRVGRKKPIVVLKGGRSANGASAARSHTGAIAGSYEVFRSLLEQVGAHEVTRSDELLRVGEMLAGQPPFRSGGVVVLADGGGHATLATDALESLEVPLAKLTPATRTRLAELLHSAAAVSNPIDLAGAADRAPAVFARVFQELRRDPECAGVVITGLLGGYALRFTEELEAEETAAAAEIGRLAREASLPTVVHTVYAESGTRALARLARRRRGRACRNLCHVQSIGRCARNASTDRTRGAKAAGRAERSYGSARGRAHRARMREGRRGTGGSGGPQGPFGDDTPQDGGGRRSSRRRARGCCRYLPADRTSREGVRRRT